MINTLLQHKGLKNLISNTPPKTERLLSLFLIIVISLMTIAMLTVIKEGLKKDLTAYYNESYESKGNNLIKQIEHFLEVRHIELEAIANRAVIKQSVMNPTNNIGLLRDLFSEYAVIGEFYPQLIFDFKGDIIFSSESIFQSHNFLNKELRPSNEIQKQYQDIFQNKKALEIQISQDLLHWTIIHPILYGKQVEGILVTYIPISDMASKLDLIHLSGLRINASTSNGRAISWGANAAKTGTQSSSSILGIEFSFGIDLSLLNNTFSDAINRLIIGAIIIAIIATGLAIVLGRWFFVRPIQRLQMFADELSKGSSDPHLIKTKRITIEIQQLSDKITDMAREIHKREQALIESNIILKRNQDTLIQAEKMAGLGQVTAGVAHEINNPIGFIMNNLSMLEEYHLFLKKLVLQLMSLVERMSDDEKQDHQDLLRQINTTLKEENLDFVINDLNCLTSESIKGTTRVKDIIFGLKGYAYSGEKVSLVDINECIESTLNMVWNELKYHCEVVKDLQDIPQIECIGGQINQVLMNLFINASHAMPKTGGELKIQTYQVKNDIFIVVSDNGCGIKPDDLKRIFEPFFTTKPVGEGTGLGMSICYDIIKNHGGHIVVESEVGHGTSFCIRLPVSHSA